MRTYCIAQGTLLSVLLWTEREGNPKKRGYNSSWLTLLYSRNDTTLYSNSTAIKINLKNKQMLWVRSKAYPKAFTFKGCWENIAFKIIVLKFLVKFVIRKNYNFECSHLWSSQPPPCETLRKTSVGLKVFFHDYGKIIKTCLSIQIWIKVCNVGPHRLKCKKKKIMLWNDSECHN